MAFAIAPLLAILKEYRRRQNERRHYILTQRALDELPGELRKGYGLARSPSGTA